MRRAKRIRQIRQRLDRAAARPWYVHVSGKAWLRVANLDDEQIIRFLKGDQDSASVDFICHAPDDVAFLLAEIDRLKKPRWWRKVEE